ncbi:ABC transporter permease [Gloeothece citriformis]|nr:ABC transporter permease [Gloeothece citriformis]
MQNSRRRKQRQRILYLWDLMRELVGRDIKIQYKRSVLGIAWSFITPLMQLVVYYFIFRSVLSLNISNYAAFIFTGMLVWNWFQMSLFQGASAITNSRELIRQPGFPTAILPTVAIATNIINFLISLPILLLFLGNTWAKPPLLFLPILIIIQFLLTLSLNYLMAALNVTFRDTQHILGILLNMFFFLNPIFYGKSNFPEQYLPLYNLNPIAHLIEAYRTILLDGKLPNLMPLLIVGLISVGLLVITYKYFCQASDYFAEEL